MSTNRDQWGPRCGHGVTGAFSLLLPWARVPAPGLPAKGQGEAPAALQVTLLWEGVEAPGDPGDPGVEAAAGRKALLTGDAWEAAILPVLRVHPRALAGSCGDTRSARPARPPGQDRDTTGPAATRGNAKSSLTQM